MIGHIHHPVPSYLQGSIWWSPWSELQPKYQQTGPIPVQYRNFWIVHGNPNAPVAGAQGGKAPLKKGVLAPWANGVPAGKKAAMDAFRKAHLKQPSGWEKLPDK